MAQPEIEPIISPILSVGPSFKRWAMALGAVVAWAAMVWVWQLYYGLGATNLGRPTTGVCTSRISSSSSACRMPAP